MAEEAEPADFICKAVVLNGRVVLDERLDVPDGTLVTVWRYEIGDLPGELADKPSAESMVRQLATLVDVHSVKLRALEQTLRRQGGQDAA